MKRTRVVGTLFDAKGDPVVVGVVTIRLQTDIVSVDGEKVAPIPISVDLADTSGLIDVYLAATDGASPSGVAYLVEYDPSPDDLSKPAYAKQGYWKNLWVVPDETSVPLGNFVSAERNVTFANYMPLGGTISQAGDSLTLGTGTNTTKELCAAQASTTPKLRYNHTLSRWEYSNDGTVFNAMGSGGTGGSMFSEIPSGVIDGVNRVFVLSATPLWCAVFLNGVRMIEGALYDYTRSGDTVTFHVDLVPESGSVVSCDYSL